MSQNHVSALKKKHHDIEKKIREELKHPSRNEILLRRLRQEKLHIKEKLTGIAHDTA